jgi:hypothetical protein
MELVGQSVIFLTQNGSVVLDKSVQVLEQSGSDGT